MTKCYFKAICFMTIFFTLLTGHSFAGKYNPDTDIGDPAPQWENLPGVDGKLHSLSDLKEKDFVVVVFTCNSCPVAEAYEDRLISFAHQYTGPEKKVALVAINVNKIEEDSLEQMKVRAESKGFPFPYLYDESQQVAKGFGAAFTPEFFVLDKERKIVYMGGMDDSSNPEKVENHFLEMAIQDLVNGKTPEVQETVAFGCLIRFERERRSRKPRSKTKD
ncbi:Thiol-disulfide oxidoreductase ResA [Planctomycetales bacterium 10988]|nr:Thiol-disulfide oxidoreductase ResA [Planctomycetales bacterium 10988]